MAEEAAPPPPLRFLFLEAEEAADAAVKEVIDQASSELYDLYLDRNSYPFACEVVVDVIRARMGMAFVPFDPGELSDEGWLPEPPPERPPLDAWARAAVPIKKRADAITVRTAPKKVQEKRNLAARAAPAEKEEPQIDVKGQWSIMEEVAIDKDEEAMRDVKQREDNKRKAEVKRDQRVAEEAEQRAKAARARAEAAETKQMAFDSDGNVLFVQQVAGEKLPPPVQLVSYKYKDTAPPPKPADEPAKPEPRRKEKKKKEPVFTDLFTRLANQQPACIDVIELAPGVQCTEKGKNRSGAVAEPAGYTRKAYEEMVQNGGEITSATVGKEEPKAETKPVAPEPVKVVEPNPVVEPPSPRKVPPPPAEARAPHAALPTLDEFNSSVVNNAAWGENPPSPSHAATQAQAPNAAHSWKLKRDAVGNLGKVPRDRLAGLGSTGRYRLPQPPLGAVMGHGLYGEGVDGEFYYPGGSPSGPTSPSGKTQRSPTQGTEKPQPMYDAASIGHALNLAAQRAEGGGVITTRRAELVKTIIN